MYVCLYKYIMYMFSIYRGRYDMLFRSYKKRIFSNVFPNETVLNVNIHSTFFLISKYILRENMMINKFDFNFNDFFMNIV